MISHSVQARAARWTHLWCSIRGLGDCFGTYVQWWGKTYSLCIEVVKSGWELFTNRETLIRIYGAKKYHIHLYGQSRFTLITDHHPLLAIIGPKSGFPSLRAARLQCWTITLSTYTCDLEYCFTHKMGKHMLYLACQLTQNLMIILPALLLQLTNISVMAKVVAQ